MDRHAQNLSIDAQLLVSTNPVAVCGDQRQFFWAKPHHTTRSQLGGGGRLTHTGRSHQRIHAALVHQRIFIVQHRQLALQRGLDIGQARSITLPGCQISQEIFGQTGAKASPQQGAKQMTPHRVTPLSAAPRNTSQLLFDHAAHRMDFPQDRTIFAGCIWQPDYVRQLGYRYRHNLSDCQPNGRQFGYSRRLFNSSHDFDAFSDHLVR